MLTGIKNLDLIILSKLDDESRVNFSLTCKYNNELFNDEGFWKDRTNKNFPTFVKYNCKNWKNYYFSILNDFFRLLDFAIFEEKSVENMDKYELFVNSIKLGLINVVKFFIDKGYIILEDPDSTGLLLNMAVTFDQKEIFKYLVNSGCHITYLVLQSLCITKNQELLNYVTNEKRIKIPKYLYTMGDFLYLYNKGV